MKKVIIFGGSGFIGSHLVEELKDSYEIVIITRRPRTLEKQFEKKITVHRLRTRDISKIVAEFEDAEVVINLAGENVNGRWNKKKMAKIRNSRLDVDSVIVRTCRSVAKMPKVIIQGSGMGVYGLSRNTIDVTEETPLGQRGFLPKVAISHEDAFKQLEKLTRVVYIRTGLVLDANDGALPKIAAPYKYYLGGKLGNGNQWNSWIHIKDEVRAIRFLIENKDTKGAYNLTAPNPVKQKELAAGLGKILKRPSFMPKPSFLLRLYLGAMADELLLNGLKVLPEKLINDGFKFKFETIDSALSDIYGDSK